MYIRMDYVSMVSFLKGYQALCEERDSWGPFWGVPAMRILVNKGLFRGPLFIETSMYGLCDYGVFSQGLPGFM